MISSFSLILMQDDHLAIVEEEEEAKAIAKEAQAPSSLSSHSLILFSSILLSTPR